MDAATIMFLNTRMFLATSGSAFLVEPMALQAISGSGDSGSGYQQLGAAYKARLGRDMRRAEKSG
jgi:predicted NAD-dependent protein-ADP-ribosyltransferase YbiA (DUF1768 family)